jgi:hypothetical protein
MIMNPHVGSPPPIPAPDCTATGIDNCLTGVAHRGLFRCVGWRALYPDEWVLAC